MFGEKGRGVVAMKNFAEGEFVVEYANDLIGLTCAKEGVYSFDWSVGPLKYYFKFNNHN